MENIWLAVVQHVVPALVRGAIVGLAAALTALGVLTDGDGRVPVDLPHPARSESLSKPSPLQRLSQFRFSE